MESQVIHNACPTGYGLDFVILLFTTLCTSVCLLCRSAFICGWIRRLSSVLQHTRLGYWVPAWLLQSAPSSVFHLHEEIQPIKPRQWYTVYLIWVCHNPLAIRSCVTGGRRDRDDDGGKNRDGWTQSSSMLAPSAAQRKEMAKTKLGLPFLYSPKELKSLHRSVPLVVFQISLSLLLLQAIG